MYSPKISEELIPELYRIGKAAQKPMTQIVNAMLRDSIIAYHAGSVQSEGTMSISTENARLFTTLRAKVQSPKGYFSCPCCHNDERREKSRVLEGSLRITQKNNIPV